MLYGEMPEVRLNEDAEPVQGFRFSVPNPKKVAIARIPTAAEIKKWIARQRNSKNESYEADFELFKTIRVIGDEFDECEARLAIVRLTAIELLGSERVEEGFKITLKSPFGEHAHVMGIPTSKQLVTAVRTGKIGGELYDQAVQLIEGYVESITPKDVPEHHKQAVGAELVRLVDALYEADFVPNK